MHNKTISTLSLFAILVGSNAALAASGPDLSVSIIPDSSPALANSTVGYQVKVTNSGNKKASNVSVTIDLPKTNTSPTRYLLGTASTASPCSLSGSTITCSISSINAGKNASVGFSYSMPVNSSSPSIVAKATVSGDTDASDNETSYSPTLSYHSVSLSAPVTVTNSHCTGQNLIAYFECTLFPSSISSHQIRLESDGSITFLNSGTDGYTGGWQRSSDGKQLSFQYMNNGNTIVSFVGKGSSDKCYDAVVTSGGYTIPYRACVP